MDDTDTNSAVVARAPLAQRRDLAALLPQVPLALALWFVGAMNILDGLGLAKLRSFTALDSLEESLSAVGGTAEVILGIMLLVAGIGLLRRLSFAWTLAVLLLVITVAVRLAQAKRGFGLGLQVIMLTALILTRGHFTRRTAMASVVFSLTNILAILAYGILGSYLLGKGFSPEIHDLNTACYFAVTSLSTVGYGDIVPVTSEARWFVVSLLVIGLSVFASTIASVLGPAISQQLDRLFNPKEKIVEPKDHIILIGKGSIAMNTAAELKQRGIHFVQIVTTKPEAGAAEHRIIEGDATSEEVLKQAGIQHARMVIAAREDDSENAFIVLAIKEMNPGVPVLAVASSAISLRRLKLARADMVFSPSAVGSRLMADLVQGNQILPEFRDLLEGHLKKAEAQRPGLATPVHPHRDGLNLL
jgi:voltage-gated potassium channel